MARVHWVGNASLHPSSANLVRRAGAGRGGRGGRLLFAGAHGHARRAAEPSGQGRHRHSADQRRLHHVEERGRPHAVHHPCLQGHAVQSGRPRRRCTMCTSWFTDGNPTASTGSPATISTMTSRPERWFPRALVHIDLQGGTGRDQKPETPSPETKNPIHLAAEGMTFNQKTGLAESDGRVDFQLPQAAGTAHGATYDSKNNQLTLHSAVDINTAGQAADPHSGPLRHHHQGAAAGDHGGRADDQPEPHHAGRRSRRASGRRTMPCNG